MPGRCNALRWMPSERFVVESSVNESAEELKATRVFWLEHREAKFDDLRNEMYQLINRYGVYDLMALREEKNSMSELNQRAERRYRLFVNDLEKEPVAAGKWLDQAHALSDIELPPGREISHANRPLVLPSGFSRMLEPKMRLVADRTPPWIYRETSNDDNAASFNNTAFRKLISDARFDAGLERARNDGDKAHEAIQSQD